MPERITSKTIYSAAPGEKSPMDAVRAYAERQAAKSAPTTAEPEPSEPSLALEPRPPYESEHAEADYESVDGEAVAEEDLSSPESDEDIADAEVIPNPDEEATQEEPLVEDEINEEDAAIDAYRILDDINNADLIRDPRKRETRLADLALKHSGVMYRGRVDLGIEAAKRISKSKVRRWYSPRRMRAQGKKRYTDHYLEKLALEKGNLNAAKSMSTGKYYSPRARRASTKGRNAVMVELIDRAEQNGNSALADTLTENYIRGLGKSESYVKARERLAIYRDNPNLVLSIDGLHRILKKEKAIAKVALGIAKTDKAMARRLARTINLQRNLRSTTLVEISKIR